MPGIVGIIGRGPAHEKASAVQEMIKSMMHETFYTPGSRAEEALGLSIGWVNRSGSFADCMPVRNETGDIYVIFSGENFADQSEIDYLRTRGHAFDPQNASYLVHQYEEYGPKFIEKLNGWFSGILVDLRSKSAVLFNDRYGFGRIYFHENKGLLYFASEAKALLKILPGLRSLDITGLGEQFSCGCVLQNRTLFRGVSLLPTASRWTFSKGGEAKREIYFDKRVWENQEPLSRPEYHRKLKETFRAILPRYLRGKEPVAISLTGGVDSRMIMAWAKEPAGKLPCFTFGGPYRDCTDVKIARRVAEICGQPHHILPVGKNFLAEFPSLARKTVYITDGAMDMCGTPDLFTSRMARDIAPVRLTGNYGGEILRSLVAFKPHSFAPAILSGEFKPIVQSAETTYFKESAGPKPSFVAFKQVPWHHYSRMSLERSQLTIRSPYLDNDLVAVAFRVPPDIATSNEPALRVIADGSPALARIGTDRGILYQPLPMITRLNNLYQEFTFKAEYAYDYGMPQWVAAIDHLLSPLRLERLFLGRHKFYHFRVWYRDDLAPFVREILLDPRALNRAYLNGREVEKIVKEHTSGNRNYTLEIHRLLTTELIQRTLIEQR